MAIYMQLEVILAGNCIATRVLWSILLLICHCQPTKEISSIELYLTTSLLLFLFLWDSKILKKDTKYIYLYTYLYWLWSEQQIYKQKPRTFAVLPRLKNTEIYHHIPLSWSLCDKQNGKIIGMPIWYLTVYIYQKALWVDQKRIL